MEPTDRRDDDQDGVVSDWRFLEGLGGGINQHHGVTGDEDLKNSESVQPVSVQTGQLEMLHTVMVDDDLLVEVAEEGAQDDGGELGGHHNPLEGPGDTGSLKSNQFENDMDNVHTEQLCVYKLYSGELTDS